MFVKCLYLCLLWKFLKKWHLFNLGSLGCCCTIGSPYKTSRSDVHRLATRTPVRKLTWLRSFPTWWLLVVQFYFPEERSSCRTRRGVRCTAAMDWDPETPTPASPVSYQEIILLKVSATFCFTHGYRMGIYLVVNRVWKPASVRENVISLVKTVKTYRLVTIFYAFILFLPVVDEVTLFAKSHHQHFGWVVNRWSSDSCYSVPYSLLPHHDQHYW